MLLGGILGLVMRLLWRIKGCNGISVALDWEGRKTLDGNGNGNGLNTVQHS